jgi:hypothetical protein
MPASRSDPDDAMALIAGDTREDGGPVLATAPSVA